MTGRDAHPGATLRGPQRPEPEQWNGHVREPCPACGSSRTVHALFGLQVVGTPEPEPGWIRFAGCCPPWEEPEHSCSACGAEWSSCEEDDDGAEEELRRIGGQPSEPGNARGARRG